MAFQTGGQASAAWADLLARQSRGNPAAFFSAGNHLYALDPKTGQPIGSFGKDGLAPLPGSATAGPAIFEHVIVVPGYERDVWGLDLLSGRLLWTFHTVPREGEFGYD